jgi:acyl-CoA synthetase (AMP-forming)/AMP-acid ligase II
MHVIDFFDRGATAFPRRTCLSDRDGTSTFAEVHERTVQIAALLQSRKAGPGTAVGVLSGNASGAFECMLGTIRAGCVWAPLNVRATASELAHYVTLVQCRYVFFQGEMEPVVSYLRAHCPCVSEFILFDRAEDDSWPTLDRLLGDFLSPFAPPAADLDAIISVFGTGGTTGLPKAAAWSHRTWNAMVANFASGIHHEGPPVHLVAAPMTHAAGVISIPLMALGATTVLIDRPAPELILEKISSERVTTLFLPPTAIYSLIAHPDVRKHNTSSLQNFIYAAAPMSVDKLKEAIEIFGPVFVQTYGQAEAPMTCTILTREDHSDALRLGLDHRLGSCGRPALFTGVAVLDDDDNILERGKTGEIAVRGDLLMREYLHDADATATITAGRWRRTGDVGHVDEDGFVYITDRKRDMIISGGFNIYPAEVERIILSHPSVLDCAVVGAPHEKWGEAVTAVVELRDGCGGEAQAELFKEILEACRDRLGSVKAPKAIHEWPELPRSAVGKVLRREVRTRFWASRSKSI